MYYRTLNIGLFGIHDDITKALENLQPLERFTYKFSTHAATTVDAVTACDIAIVDYEAMGSMTITDIRKCVYSSDIGFHALVLVASSFTVSNWSRALLNEVDALWPQPLSVDRAVFEFEKLVKSAKDEAEIYIANTYLDTLIDSMPEMVWFKQLDGEHLKVNTYFCGIVDKPREDVVGKFHNYIWSVPPEDWEKAELTCQESDNAAIQAGKTMRCDENVSTHGEIRLFDTYKTPIFDEDGTILGTSGFAHDVTLERELQHMAWVNANTDYMTGVYNRRYFYEFISEQDESSPVSLIMIDLDNFKSINDTLGHEVGDNMLLLVTEILSEEYPDCPIVRWGGDEFIIVVRGDHKELAQADNFKKAIEKIERRSGEFVDIKLSASAGIADGATSQNVDEVIAKADAALYKAKESGKSSCLHA